MDRKLAIGLIGGAVLFAGCYLASPLVAVHSLTSAAKSGDAERLQRLVDFPAVRESLKSQLNAMVIGAMQSDPELADNPFAGLAFAFGPAIVNQAVDSYVTADGISAMMSARVPQTATGIGTASALGRSPAAGQAALKHGYKDLNTYVISSADEANPSARFSFVLYRQGLFGWRLTRIELPKELASTDQSASVAPVKAAPSEPTSPDVQRLVARWFEEHSACRGGSGDDPATYQACEAREKTDAELAQAGWCYGENAAYSYQAEWRPCGSPRFASEAEAEHAAAMESASQ